MGVDMRLLGLGLLVVWASQGCSREADCTEPGGCAPVPSGWDGPVAVVLGEQPACDRDVLALGYLGLDGAPAACECTCTPERSVPECTATGVLSVYPDDDRPCDEQTAVTEVPIEPECTGFGIHTGASFELQVIPGPAKGVSCTPELTVGAPDPTWETRAAVCVIDAVPEPSRVCIWLDDDLACPGGAYSERHLLQEGIDDNRTCGDCTCGEAEVTCDMTADLFAVATCVGVSTGMARSGACEGVATVVRAAELTPGDPEVSCEPSTSTPSGSVEEVDSFTLCCLPESP